MYVFCTYHVFFPLFLLCCNASAFVICEIKNYLLTYKVRRWPLCGEIRYSQPQLPEKKYSAEEFQHFVRLQQKKTVIARAPSICVQWRQGWCHPGRQLAMSPLKKLATFLVITVCQLSVQQSVSPLFIFY